MISIGLGTVSWIALAFTPHVYADLLWVCIIINIFMVVASCVLGAYMVEIAQATSGSGRLTALRQVVQQGTYLVRGPLGGIWPAPPSAGPARPAAASPSSSFPWPTSSCARKRSLVNSEELIANAGRQLVKIGAAKTMWAAAGLMALFYIAPGFSTATLYIQQNQLHMSTQATGFTQSLYGMAGIIAALGYGFICRRLRLRTLLVICLGAATATALGYLFYPRS